MAISMQGASSPCGTDRWRPLQRLRQKARLHRSSGSMGGGLRAGLSEAEIVKMMLLISVHAGFPAALNGILATREVASSIKKNE